jgi:outer membrane protein TolC
MRKVLIILLLTPIIIGAEPMSFEQALELAEERSEILMLQRSAVRRADLALAEARSRLGPELTFQVGGGYLANPPEGITVETGELGIIPNPLPPPPSISIPAGDLTFIEDARSGYFELSMQLTQPLYTWGKLDASVDLASLGLKTSRADFTEQRRQLHQNVHRSYFSAVLSRDSAVLLQQILDILLEIEQDRERALALGSANKFSVLQIQTQISRVRRRMVQAHESYSTALEALAMFTELDPQKLELSTDFRKELPPLAEAELKQKAERNSTDLRKALLDQEQARAKLKLTQGRAIFRPDISFSLAFEFSGQTIPWSEDGWEDTWDLNLTAGVGTQGALFDSGLSRHQLQQAEEESRASQVAVDLLRKQIHLKTRKAIELLWIRWAEIQELENEVIQAQEEEKNARQAFQQQLFTREQWGAARIVLLQKKVALLESEYSFELALKELEILVGFP